MTQGKNNPDLTELLLKCMAEPDLMLSMLEWLCAQLMEAEALEILKNPSASFQDHRREIPVCGCPPFRVFCGSAMPRPADIPERILCQ